LVETNPDTVVAPDVGFVLKRRMPESVPKRGYFRLRPDLAVEIVSPTDERADMRRKQAIYERVGVPVVWWIDPLRETVAVHKLGEPIEHLDRTGHLDGGTLLPGFSLALEVLFA
jgi:Uma2 family endonuclease